MKFKFNLKQVGYSVGLSVLLTGAEIFAGPCVSKLMSEGQHAPKSVLETFAIKDLNATIQTFLNPREIMCVRHVNSDFYSASYTYLVEKFKAAFFESSFSESRLADGFAHFAAISKDGRVKSWGDKEMRHPRGLGRVRGLFLQAHSTCAIKDDWTLVCWGMAGTEVPVHLGKALTLSYGRTHTCAIRKEDRTVVCWYSQGLGGEDRRLTTVPADLGRVQYIVAKWKHTCAIKEDQTVQCWGVNGHAHLNVPADLGKVHKITSGGMARS